MSAFPVLSARPATADPPTILVADDEVLIRIMAAEYLRAAGFRVIEASDAAEAVDVLKADASIDLLFTDIEMPGLMNGIMLARWAHLHRPELRVVLASGSSNAAAHALPGERLF